MADVYVHCRTALMPAGDPVQGVYVSIHSPGVYNSLADGITDANGQVFLGARAPGIYEIHLTPNGAAKVQEGNLQTITVVDEDTSPADGNTDPNIFDVLIDTTTLPAASDDHFCRCSGSFINPYGKPIDELTIRFSENSVFFPNLIYYPQGSANALIPTSQVVRTDSSGFASVDLLRNYEYLVFMEGYENLARNILVPDASAAPLPDIIFPAVDGVEYTLNNVLLDGNSPSVTLNVGQQTTLLLETVFRSGLRISGVVDTVLVTPEQSIISTTLTGNTLLIEALSPGNVELEVTRVKPEAGHGITIAPDPGVRGALNVLVNP